jgi:hypothetical protein
MVKPLLSKAVVEMNSVKFAEIIKVKSRFGRSVNLERDFYSRVSLDGYVLTTTSRHALGRLVEAFFDETASRAWTLTGPYGSGKSTFALFAAKVLDYKSPADSWQARNLIKVKDKELWAKLFEVEDSLFNQDNSSPRMFPILISGARESLAKAILRGVKSALQNSTNAKLQAVIKDVEHLEKTESVTGKQIVKLFGKITEVLKQNESNVGLLVVIDELGKLLEFVALRPTESDIFLLQELAEATRNTETPFFLMTILHQAFERYAEKLGRREREEWMKVQGRFEDLAFQEPNEQVLHILQSAFEKDKSALQADAINKYGQELAQHAFDLGLSGTIKKRDAVTILSDCLPLHPTVALSIGHVFRRFGQNERSLFAFLTSNETFGLQEFLETTEWNEQTRETVRLDRLHDYLISAMGSALFAGAESRKWAEIETSLNKLIDASDLEARLIKTIGLFGLLGSLGKLKSSREVLHFALSDDQNSETEIDEALEKLQNHSVITERRFNDTFAIWEGSDINLDERFREAATKVDPTISLAESLKKNFRPRPLVAKRHSDETGTLRFFELTYADADDVREICRLELTEADGRIVYALTNNQEEYNDLRKQIKKKEFDVSVQTIIAIPKNLANLREAVFATACWHWVQRNTPKLENDRAARTELAARLFHAEQSVLNWLNDLQSNTASENCVWFWQGEEVLLPTARSLQEFLSKVCGEVFPNTPVLLNELINRRNLSSAAAGARKLLFDAMITNPTKSQLGIEGFPPQLSMYFSLLQETTIHREENRVWGFFPPNEDANEGIRTVWKRIEEFLVESERTRQTVAELFQILQAPPYGLKTGVLPILLGAILMHYEAEVALYERGSFVAKLTIPIFERLCKSPDAFALQYCRISEVRTQVIEKLATTLLPAKISKKKDRLDVLTLVRPLVVFSNGLDEFTKHTTRVSPEAQKVRQAMISAREPDSLLFKQLPEAFGLPPFSESEEHTPEQVNDFCQKLQKSLGELKRAYEDLLDEIEKMLISGFALKESGVEMREELKNRVRLIADHTASAKLKSFVLRVNDDSLDFRAWLESLGSLLVGKPLSHWLDADISRFEINLAEMVRSFTSLETLAFEIKNKDVDFSQSEVEYLRLSLTRLGEVEQERVLSISPKEKELLATIEKSLENEFEKIGLNGNIEMRLTVLANLSWKLLQKSKKD